MKKKIILTIRPYVKEHHIQIGDKVRFEKALSRLGVEKREEEASMWSWKGIKIFESEVVPEDKAVLVDKLGNIIQVYTV